MLKKKNYNIPNALKQILKDEELSLYEEYYNTEACKKVREMLAMALSKDIEISLLKSEKEVRYTDSDWPLSQADAIGDRRATRKFIKLLTH